MRLPSYKENELVFTFSLFLFIFFLSCLSMSLFLYFLADNLRELQKILVGRDDEDYQVR